MVRYTSLIYLFQVPFRGERISVEDTFDVIEAALGGLVDGVAPVSAVNVIAFSKLFFFYVCFHREVYAVFK